MATIYNYSEFTEATNMVDWMFVLDGWADGLFFELFLLGIILLIFASMRFGQVSVENTMIGISLAGFLMSGTLFLIRDTAGAGLLVGGVTLPIGFLLILPIAFIMKANANTL